MSKRKEALNTSWWSILSNLALAIIKGAAGILGNSFALIADAVESTTDVFASTVVMFGLRYSTRPADDNHPYGHGRAESLVTFLITGFLVFSATVIAVQGIQNLFRPQEMPQSYTLIILGGIIVVKEGLYRFVTRRSENLKSTSLKADAWHHRSDAISSLVAFIGIGAALLLGEGWEKLDDIAALVASGVIYYNAWLIFRPALGEAMDEARYDQLIEQLRKLALTVNGIKGTEKCYVRKMGMNFLVDIHAIVDGEIPVSKGHELAHRLKDAIMKEYPEITDVLVHIEPD